MIVSLIEQSPYSRSRREVAKAVGVSPAALSQYIHGQASPSMRVLTALADFFGVTLDYLVYGEAAANPVDFGPLARYVDHALAGVQERASRRTALVSNIAKLLGERIDEVAEHLADSGGAPAGFIHDNELLQLENHSTRTDLISINLQHDLISIDGVGDAAGRFLPTVATNISRDRPYRFLVPSSVADAGPLATRLRQALIAMVGGDKVHSHCHFRRATQPVTNDMALYQVDVAALAAEHQILHLHISPYLGEGGRFGYVITPNSDSHGDLIMDQEHLNNAAQAYERLWLTGQVL